MRTLRYSGWLTAAALTLSATLPAHADEKADRLVKEVIAATSAAKTLTADLSLAEKTPQGVVKGTGKIKLKRPNFALVAVTTGPMPGTVASDGKTVISLMPGNQYMKEPADPHGKNINQPSAFMLAIFFDPASGLKMFAQSPLRYVGTETVGGRQFEVLEGKSETVTSRFYVNEDRLVTRVSLDAKQGDSTMSLVEELSNVKVNAPITVADLAFTLPKTAKLYKQPDYNAKLIPVGKMAEKFDLMGLGDKHVTLDDAGAGKKAVLVNFWFYG